MSKFRKWFKEQSFFKGDNLFGDLLFAYYIVALIIIIISLVLTYPDTSVEVEEEELNEIWRKVAKYTK